MEAPRAQVLEGLGPSHTVQFYEDSDYLCRTVAEFISIGLKANQPALVVTSPPRSACVRAHLSDLGRNAGELQAAGRLMVLDAEETLATFMDGRMPVREFFHKGVGRLVERLQNENGGAPVRAYGDMVDLLWQSGKPEAAIRVEDLWTELAAKAPLALLCGYSMSHFAGTAQRGRLQDVCSRHTHVIPTERYMAVDGEAPGGHPSATARAGARS